MSLSDQLKNLENLVSNAMGTALEDAERTLSNQIRKLSSGLQQRAEEQALARLHDSVARIDRCPDQAGALSTLLEETGHYASRAVLYLTFTDGIRGWASYGFGDQVEALDSRLGVDEPPFADFVRHPAPTPLTGTQCTPLSDSLGAPSADEGILLPMILRRRVAAALYADRLEAHDTFVPSALALLVHACALRIESQGQPAADASPTLGSADTVEILELWDPEAVTPAEPSRLTEATVPAPPEPPEVEAPEAVAAEGPEEPAEAASTEATVRISREMMESYIEPPDEPAVADPVEPPMPLEIEEIEEIEAADLGDSDWIDTQDEAPAPPPPPPIEEPEVPEVEIDELEEIEELEVEGFDVEDAEPAEDESSSPHDTTEFEQVASDAVGDEDEEDEEDEEPTTSLAAPSVVEFDSGSPASDQAEEDEGSEEATLMLDRSTIDTPMAPIETPPAEPVEEPAPSPRPASTGGSTQVQPPSDLEGPGWAFRKDSDDEEAPDDDETTALHEEARRLARLLVSEIKLYNEEQVENGRRNRDIYSRLQDDIDRSHQMYRDRVDARVGDVDYFQQELVNILAGGDAGALGK